MRVEVVRSGGFAGRVLRWSVEVDELPTESASELRRLLDEAQSWAGPQQGGTAAAAPPAVTPAAATPAAVTPAAVTPAAPPPAAPPPAADGFRWRVVAEAPEQSLELAFSDPASGPARRLVDLVRAGAGPR